MKYGYIDKTGTFIIEAQYEVADHFINGVARVKRNKSDNWTFIDKTNTAVPHPTLAIKDAEIVDRFPSGDAWVVSKKVDKSTRYAVIDKQGQLLTQFDFYEIKIVQSESDISIAKYPDRKGCVYFDAQGRRINDQSYDKCGEFNRGLAKVVRQNKAGFLGSDGAMAIPFNFDDKYGLSFSIGEQGLIPAKIGKEYGYIDRTGKTVIPPKFSAAGSFSEGFARIAYRNESGKEQRAVIDQSGQIVFQLSYRKTGTGIHSGLISFQENGKWGFLDKAGNIAIPPTFPGGGSGTYFGPDFSEGLADVGPAKEYLRGYIDANGRYVIPPILNDASPFKDGVARVMALPKAIREKEYVQIIANWKNQQQ